MALQHEIRKQESVIQQVIKMPQQKRVEVQNVLASSVKMFQLTNELKELSRKSRVAFADYEKAGTAGNAQILAELLSEKKKAKEELSLSKREFMQATDNYISLGGELDTNEPKEKTPV